MNNPIYIIKFKDPFFNLDMQVTRGTKDEVAAYTGAKADRFNPNPEPYDCVVEIWELDVWRAYLNAKDELGLGWDEEDADLPVLTKEQVDELDLLYDRNKPERKRHLRLIDNLDINYLNEQATTGKINLIKL